MSNEGKSEKPMATFTEVFTRDKCRCVYCGRDLVHDFDSFMIAQRDHLDPRGGDELENVVTACAGSEGGGEGEYMNR